jgi:archaellum component FlaC
MTALENQNAAFNELQKDSTEKTQLVEKMKIELQAAKKQLIQHRKEFDRLSKDVKKSDKLVERIAKLTKDLNTVKTEQRRSNKTSSEF